LEKPNYPTFNYQQTPYSIGTGGISSMATTNKSNSSYPSFDITSNLNHLTSSLYRRHTESALPTSTSIYSTSTTTHPSPSPFNYSHTTTHYHPSQLFFGWNNGPSLMRTHSASYRDYPQTTSFPCYNPMTAPNNKSTDNLLSTRTQMESINTPTNDNYPSFLNAIPPINFSLPPPSAIPTNSTSHKKRSIPSTKKRPRLTAQLRNEILKLIANKPTVFVWEIQQTLLQNGICTAQTLPQATVIQRILNESTKTVRIIKEETKPNVDLLMQTIFNNIEHKTSSPVTICLPPSSSPALSTSESASECSICLETYCSGQEVSILSCSHEYHSSCIKEWMMKSRSCPMCRKDIHNQPQFVTLLI